MIIETMKALLIAGLLVILPSCGPSVRQKIVRFDWKVLEARNPDIPFPIGLEPDYDFVPEPGLPTVFVFHAKQSIDQLRSYYLREMERCGWQHNAYFEGPHTVLNFEKPSRWCTIVLDASTIAASRVAIYSRLKDPSYL